MRLRINELKSEVAHRRGKKKITYAEIQESTGIPKKSLTFLNNGSQLQVRMTHVEALMKFFGLTDTNELFQVEDIDLPLR